MTAFEFVNRFLVLCKYLTCEWLLSHHSLKILKKWEEAISHTDVYAFQGKPTYSISVFVRTVSGKKLGKTCDVINL